MGLNTIKGKLSQLFRSPWAIVLLLGIATVLRLWKISDWSLWEDEEATIYFSQHLGKPFPSSFPVFFLALNGVFRLTGVSVGAGRFLAAAMGVLSIYFLYACFRKWISREAAFLAGLLLAINLGHLFWSQSIRYYTMVLVLQLLSMYWFLEGFEQRKYRALILSNIAFAIALLTHFSAVLLAPVFVLFLALMIWNQESDGAYNLKGYLVFGIPLLAILGYFAFDFFQQLQLQASLGEGGGIMPSARDPLKFLVRVLAYFGMPVVGLGLLAPFIARQIPKRIMHFLVIAGILPIVELIVITLLNMVTDVVSVTWYYGFFSLIGFVILASLSLVSLHQRGYRVLSVLLGSATVLYYTVFLIAYHTTMHGGRPQWEEATAYLQQAACVQVQSDKNPEIFATAPGVVAFYLGVDPSETMGHPLVKKTLFHPPTSKQASDRWILIKANCITEEYASWLTGRCNLKARFESQIGPFDQWSILVYHCKHSMCPPA
ncbi:MAG: glycosyltransferase family 39 protein [Proteobacteria bacterium]|nr:glycosyltransferase family 39 protein [Pseudomonadota bacterium]MBU4259943.1 glycosyltransferase family 39 protein [Pseudomonadota bacterium]MBU4286582.1 glycosyltransferase family 39 protein [Pseudomonadota bacterium]MCG2758648.1 glycosyltransferase family 39 protein [Desulfobacteraceae bacterium]